MKKILFISLLVVALPVLAFSATSNVPNPIRVKFDTEKITMTDNEDVASINLKTRDIILNNKVIIKNYKYDISDSFIRETLKNKDGKIIFDMNSISNSISSVNVSDNVVAVQDKTAEAITLESCVTKAYDIYNYIISEEYTNTPTQQEQVISRILELQDTLNYKTVTGYSHDDKGVSLNMMINTMRYMASDKGTKIYNYYLKEFEGYNTKFIELYNK